MKKKFAYHSAHDDIDHAIRRPVRDGVRMDTGRA